jgi:hypothetical protein
MPKISIRGTAEAVTLKLAGALIGPWVDELERTLDIVQSTRQERALRIDLSELTNVSPDGRRLLAEAQRDGAQLVSGSRQNGRFVDVLTRRALGQHVVERDLDLWPTRPHPVGKR